MPERQLTVKPLGLITQPNKLGVFPPGAMSQAKDMIVRAPSLMQQAYTKTTAWATPAQRSRLLHSTANQLIALQRSSGGVWSASWISHALTSPTLNSATLPYATDTFSQTGRLQAITLRGRTVINAATSNPIVADYENPSSSTERTFRYAGLPQPWLNASISAAPTEQALSPDTTVTLTAILTRTTTDGYVLASRPAPFIRVGNTALDPADIGLNCFWDASNNTIQAGDVLEIYRSQGVPLNAGAGDGGTTVYLVASVVLTAGQNSASLTDKAIASNVGGPLGGLGREIYTNPRFGGLTYSNDPPPVAACIASFRGRAWYANCRFPARIKFGTHQGIGALITDTARTNGIGTRVIGGTWSVSGNTISGITAQHMLGLASGQRIFATGFASLTEIVSVGVSSIVVSNTATIAGTPGTVGVEDVIEIDGVKRLVGSIMLNGFQDEAYRLTSLRTLTDYYSVAQEFQLEKQRYVLPATGTIRASSGAKYDPPLPLLSATPTTIQPTQLKNYVRYSKDQQPEAVPPTNELWVGNGEIYAMVPTRDALWFFCSDGLFRLSGTIAPISGVPDIRVDPVDSTISLAGPRAWCVLRDRIYAYTNVGLVEISDDGITPISLGVIGDLLPGQRWTENENPYLIADTRVDEIYVMGATALNFVYSARYQTFTTTSQFDGTTVGIQLASSLALVFGYTFAALDELQPDLTALLTSGPICDLQPVFGNRPDLVKQWMDVTFIMEADSVGRLDARFNAGAFTSIEFLVSLGNDVRATVGVPQDSPAIGPSLGVGFAVNTSGKKSLSGISLRYATFTEQAGAR